MIGKIILNIGKKPNKARLCLTSVISYCKELLVLGVGSVATEKHCNLYARLCLKLVFPAVKLTQNYLHYNINIFS